MRRSLKDVSSRDLAAGDKGLLFGPTKTGANRTISLPKFLREMLTEYRHEKLGVHTRTAAVAAATP